VAGAAGDEASAWPIVVDAVDDGCCVYRKGWRRRLGEAGARLL
jgi:hypothetical protein